ncbi:TPA: hypothetical protein SG275_001384 [Campylobacter coli]|nr:hypothetical protein [Campylobacter coli]
MISAIDLSNITFNPSIQIISFFKDYKEITPGVFKLTDDFDLSTELFFVDTKESIDNIIKLIILDPELTQSVKFGSIEYDFIINNKNLYRKIIIDPGSIIDKFSTIPFEYGYEEPSKDMLKEFNEFIDATARNYRFKTKNPKGIIITNTKDLKFTELNDFLRNPGTQTFFNTDARDFDILRRESTMVTPDNIFFNRKGELVCVNDFVNPLKIFKRTTAMMLAS